VELRAGPVHVDHPRDERFDLRQIARHLGARRVIGSTSTRAKGELLRQRLGYDFAVTRDAGPISAQLRRVAPDEWTRFFSNALRTGQMHFPCTRIRGLENAPAALCDAMRGRYAGTVVVEL
jgi:NADPH-dependent curcumin reductase CurA